MTDLIKEFRELHAKTTQGEWYDIASYKDIFDVLLKTTKTDDLKFNEHDILFSIKAHNNLPKLLDELEKSQERAGFWGRSLARESQRLKRTEKALELCKEQRDSWAREFEQEVCGDIDIILDRESAELDQILKGEVSE